jgi:hypothetical protein
MRTLLVIVLCLVAFGLQPASPQNGNTKSGTAASSAARLSTLPPQEVHDKDNEALLATLSQHRPTFQRGRDDLVAFGDDVSLFNDDARYLWPGALLDSQALLNGKIVPLSPSEGLARRMGTLIVSDLYTTDIKNAKDLPTLHGVPHVFTVDVTEPSFPNVHDALHWVFANNRVEPAATRANIDIKSFDTIDEALTKVGASASYMGASLKASVSSETYNENNNFVIKVLQPYFTVDFLYPGKGQLFFSGSTRLKAADVHDNDPAYVSSITYGRLYLFFASSRTQKNTFTNRGAIR